MAKTMNLVKLRKQHEQACDQYVKKFCKRQDLIFHGWAGGIVGGMANCGDYYFNYHDIVWDVNSQQEKGLIISWYSDNSESPVDSISYFSYTSGLRIQDLKKHQI